MGGSKSWSKVLVVVISKGNKIARIREVEKQCIIIDSIYKICKIVFKYDEMVGNSISLDTTTSN